MSDVFVGLQTKKWEKRANLGDVVENERKNGETRGNYFNSKNGESRGN